jgi:hypothetical protein
MFLVLTTSICLRTKWVPRDNESHKVKHKASSNWRASETLLWISRQERVTHEQPRLGASRKRHAGRYLVRLQ